MSRALKHLGSVLWTFGLTLLVALASGAAALWGRWPGTTAATVAGVVALTGSLLAAVRAWRAARVADQAA